jgi:hypothetical protein
MIKEENMVKNLFGYKWKTKSILQADSFTCEPIDINIPIMENNFLKLMYLRNSLKFVEWWWGKPSFRRLNQKTGEAIWRPSEMITLYGPKNKRISIQNVWLNNVRIYYEEMDNSEEFFMDLVQRVVNAYMNNESPLNAIVKLPK